MTDPSDTLRETASQTAGPYVHIGLAPASAGFDIYDRELGHDIAGPHAAGERIKIIGGVWDGTGNPATDVVLEVWQANAAGHFAHPDGGGPVEEGFRGWGRAIPDFETGTWAFDTVKPGQTRGHDGSLHAPHLSLWIVARGINTGLHTRMYFADESAANDADPVLNSIANGARRPTLIASRAMDGSVPTYRFDIRLQGEDETVFFDV